MRLNFFAGLLTAVSLAQWGTATLLPEEPDLLSQVDSDPLNLAQFSGRDVSSSEYERNRNNAIKNHRGV